MTTTQDHSPCSVSDKKKRVFEEQAVASAVPPMVDHFDITGKLSAKKFFGRKKGELVLSVDGAI